MADEPTSYFGMIQSCEQAIVRVRAAIRAGKANTEEVGNDLIFIRDFSTKRFVYFAQRARAYGPEAEQEALFAMVDQLLKDIWSPTFLSMETGFGAYLETRPKNILNRIRRKHFGSDASSYVVRLDEPVGEDDGITKSDTIADPQATQAFEALALGEELSRALAQLPQPERRVFIWREVNGLSNKEVAQYLGISDATSTRIYQRARTTLQRLLQAQKCG